MAGLFSAERGLSAKKGRAGSFPARPDFEGFGLFV
jgi:hypothetical protein